ncbi:MAG TPA: DUF1573 domain-containing protein [Isosphaeraceae bacterium]|nr:DUF1573 domain-containing protein [Isosphaeraceae bacterium]
MSRLTTFLALGAALAVRTAGAQDWVAGVFPERSFDFGTVARGSKIHHTFKLINRTNQEIHIAAQRPKCGCTDVRVGAAVIPPGTQTVIEATIDTTKFVGYKASGLTLVIDRPTFVEVDLNLTCFIRGDLVLNPGQVDFGIVARGGSPTATLQLIYAGGQPNWGIVKMQTQTTHVSAKVLDQGRTPVGQIQYLLTATLNPSVPNGYFRDEVTLFTNDSASPTIPVSVTANVQSAVTVSPSIVNLGPVRVGSVVKKTVLVRSSQPFKLTALKASRDELSAAPDPDEARPLHIINLTFKAPSQAGPYNAVFEIATDLKDEPPARLMTFANVVP